MSLGGGSSLNDDDVSLGLNDGMICVEQDPDEYMGGESYNPMQEQNYFCFEDSQDSVLYQH